ncbi:squalene--hopene cyclase [Bacillaceae bacterium Marseille-Q3522]|nr:squalene--hopene cyclase [Bacillaceae bacterium Marseille-Q3522]
MFGSIKDGIQAIIEILKKDQAVDGSWNYPFETGIATDCYMIILLRALEFDDEKLIKLLTERILSKQEKNGSWKLYYDEEEGNLSATLEAYYALLYSGYYDKKDKRLTAAKRFILKKGGIKKAHMFTKIMLALTNQYQWPSVFPLPIEMILLPPSFPIHFYSFSEYGRANLTPIMILADKKFSLKTGESPDLTEFQIRKEEKDREEEWRTLHFNVKKAIKKLIGLPDHLHKLAVEQAKQYILARLEADGTFLGYFSATFLMMFALLALGYTKTDPVIVKAVEGLKAMKTEMNGLPHMQYTTATVWNTSLISYALQEAGISPSDPMIKRANHYLLSRQHFRYGDWAVNNPQGFPGGWGFADMNTIHPDIDDTAASLRSIARSAQLNAVFSQSWERGIHWLLSMQNDDGGWSAFEKNTNSKLLQLFPIENAEFILADPSGADLTGRTLEFFGRYTNMPNRHIVIRNAVNWLERHQEKDGSWYGRWGICYIYGTWAAVTGLTAAGVLPGDRKIVRAVNWLTKIQKEDGGWGESCKSDAEKKYVPLQASTLTHTAWAVDALISASEKPTKAIRKGITFLLKNRDYDNWTTQYPAGQGMAGAFYIHYHSYRHLFPLLALSHYRNKYEKEIE